MCPRFCDILRFAYSQAFEGMRVDSIRDVLGWMVDKHASESTLTDDVTPRPAVAPLRCLFVDLGTVKLSTARAAHGLPQEWITRLEVPCRSMIFVIFVAFHHLDHRRCALFWCSGVLVFWVACLPCVRVCVCACVCVRVSVCLFVFGVCMHA
jgi:hypothetical protein